jgi:hypothetical protein
MTDSPKTALFGQNFPNYLAGCNKDGL